MVRIVDLTIAWNFPCGIHLEYGVHKTNIFTIWYTKCDSIFDEIRMMKYPQKYFRSCCLAEAHINWNKRHICIILVRLYILRLVL